MSEIMPNLKYQDATAISATCPACDGLGYIGGASCGSCGGSGGVSVSTSARIIYRRRATKASAEPQAKWRSVEATGHVGFSIVDEFGSIVCDIHAMPSGSGEDHSRLIATAPEMRDALQILVDNIEHAFPALASLRPLVVARAILERATTPARNTSQIGEG